MATVLCPQAAAAQAAEQPQAASRSTAVEPEILVTARRREESNLDVPIAVSAYSEATLVRKGVERVDDLQRIAPSLSFRPNSGRRSNSIYEIRGAAGIDSLITSDPAVGVYVDEVYRARAIGTNQSFFDIANVQVLFGPQGTLFGRNSAAGAVLINTNRPTDRFEGQLMAGIGSLDRRELTGMINVPLTDTLAVRLAGQRILRDGYGTNVTNGQKLANLNTVAGRLSVAWKPAPGIENTTIASYYNADEAGSFGVLYGYRPCPSATATTPAASCSTRSMPDVPVVDTRTIGQALAQAWATAQTLGPWQTALNATSRSFPDEDNASFGVQMPNTSEKARNVSVTNITSIALGDSLTLKNIFGYNWLKAIASTDLDGTPIALIDTYLRTSNEMFSEELQLQGETGRLTWVVGGLYFQEKGTDVQPSIQNVYSDGRSRLDGTNRSYALFAQGTYKLTDQLSLTAGGRYTWDKRFATYVKPVTYALAVDTLVRGAASCGLSPAVDTDGDCVVSEKASFSQATYTLSLDYKPSDNLLFYAAHRRGYRSGGLQARTGLIATGAPVNGITPVTSTLPFRPETVLDAEVGFKGDLDLGGDRRLNLAVSLWQAWYSDVQRSLTILTGLSSTTNPVGSATTTAITNVGEAEAKGFSAEGSLTIVRGVSLNGSLGYVDGVYKTFLTRDGVLRDIPFTNSKWTANLGLNLTPIDDGNLGTVLISGNYAYRSTFNSANGLPEIAPEAQAPAQHLFNLSANWDSIMASPISAQLWVRNLTNKRYPLGMTSLAGSFGLVTAVIAEPRTYGLNVSVKF
jgi:iron complex outermembrane recepter protein